MAKYSLDTLVSIFIPKNTRKPRDNFAESQRTLVPHADAISLYHAIKDILEYLNITTGGTTDLTSIHSTTNVVIESSSGTDATINASTTSLAGVMTAEDKRKLEALITLTGVAAEATDLGTFTGTIISDSATIKQALQELEDAMPNAGGNGIYGGSGTIAPNTIALLSLDSVFSIEYTGGGVPLFISDLNEIVTVSSPNGLHTLSTSPTNAAIEGPAGELSFNALTTIYDDNLSGHGIQYAADYSATFTNRSLVDKQYVDNAASAGIPPGTTNGQILYWDGTSWENAKLITNTQTNLSTSVVTLPHIPIASLPIDVYLNGVLKELTEDYTQATNQVVFSIPIVTSDKITTKYYY
jgi:hypothetical protein